MKKSMLALVLEWIAILVVLSLTVSGTLEVIRLTSGLTGLPLYFNQGAAILVTDGAVIYWHTLRDKYTDDKQRMIATIAMGFSIFVTLVFGASVSILAVAGLSDTQTPIDIGGGVVLPLAEVIGYFVGGVKILQFAEMLILTIICQAIDPVALMRVESAKARGILNRQTLEDFKTAQAAVLRELSSNQAISELTRQMIAQGYSEADAAILAERARIGIIASKPGGMIPADVTANRDTNRRAEVAKYAAEVENPTVPVSAK